MTPILGAISWPTSDFQSCRSIALGALPIGTQYHTNAYDQSIMKFEDEILLMADNGSLRIKDVHNRIHSGYAYLDEWLKVNNYLATIDAVPPSSIFTIPEKKRLPTQRYLRLQFTITPNPKVDK